MMASGCHAVCPTCGGALNITGGVCHCAACAKTYAVEDGVLCFTGTNNVAYIMDVDQLGEEEFNDLLNVMLLHPLPEAMAAIRKKFPKFYNYLFLPGRADWRFFVDLPPAAEVLDVGCGWGNLSVEFARENMRVTAVDAAVGKLRFLGARTRAEGLPQPFLVNADFTIGLPLAGERFDLVFLNGVLEWAGEYHEEKRPREYQEHLLKEICRVLKPGGCLYIGIENRSGYKYLFGAEDDHTGLWGTNLVPRWLADRMMQRKLSRPYRTYTYTRRGLSKLLTVTGFCDPAFFFPWDNYKYFKLMMPLRRNCLEYFSNNLSGFKDASPLWLCKTVLKGLLKRSAMRGHLRELAEATVLQSPLCFKHLVPSFGVVAQKQAGL